MTPAVQLSPLAFAREAERVAVMAKRAANRGELSWASKLRDDCKRLQRRADA